jgi:alkylated DNA repair dioxygenase AlkB
MGAVPVAAATATWQPTLLDAGTPVGFDPAFDGARRRFLGQGAWLDVVPGWVRGADALFESVLTGAPWQARTRRMWDNVVDEPRLTTGTWDDPPDPMPAMAAALSGRYGLDLSATSANLYRDGSDSVAWHGDTSGRRRDTTVVAIVSLGEPRRFLLRPKGGGPSMRFTPAHGDLLVLGGTCQRTFDHAVPKCAAGGSRISVMFREPGVF